METTFASRLFRCRASFAVFLGLMAWVPLQAETIDFKAMLERGGYLEEAPLRWWDPDTNASVFNVKFDGRGIGQGEDQLPGHVQVPIPIDGSKLKITLGFLSGSRGVASLTLTSANGQQRLRFQEDAKGIAASWRDFEVDEAPVLFRLVQTSRSSERRELVLLIDLSSSAIELSNGEVKEVVEPGTEGVPVFYAGDLVKLIASVQTDAILLDLTVEEL